ncbi:hypothetical protein LLH00_15675 [bacterium]|nr:hypothetical protein [bacterium]
MFGLCLGLCLCLAAAAASLRAEDAPGRLTLVPDSGVILLDYDTLGVSGTTTIEITPGEHLLSFFPSFSDTRWAHRYLEYPFSLGPAGERTIDLTACRVFRLRTEPQDARVVYRGRTLGRTPGDYLLLTGQGDSLTFSLRGYLARSFRLDDLGASNDLVYAALEQSSEVEIESPELETANVLSPLKQLAQPRLLISLGTGVALLATGVAYNKKADDSYEHYLHLAGSADREKAYQDALHNDRLSKAAFIAGNVSIGAFGYFVIRKLVIRRPGSAGSRSPLSLVNSARGLELSYEF